MDDQTNDITRPTRDGHGRYARDPETAFRDAEATRLRCRGLTYRAIAAELGVDVSTAHAAVARCLDETLREPAEQLRTLELERLDMLTVEASGVLEREHVVVSNGRVVMHQGAALRDDGPVLAAVTALVRISESRRKLLGLDSPVRMDVGGGVRYEVVGVDLDQLT